MLRAEHKTKNKPNQTPALSVLNCHSNAVIAFAMLCGVHSGVKSIGLSIRRDLGDLPPTPWNGRNRSLSHCFSFTHTVCWNKKHKCQRIQFIYVQEEKNNNFQSFCPTSAELKGGCWYIGGG